ncbi:RNA polymerase subunit sigma-70 [Vibrio cholerae]|nr:RNA polymerase subunit sigma-70 [Vibrio cholerae]RAL29972.1 RNA polymerase subunit sigma-70 [Vibrio cholerae]RJL29732.1 RNA polymerase subunit sigma-70 [Vibrio cholerae]
MDRDNIPFLFEAAVVLATFVHQSHSLSMPIDMNALDAYLQLQVVWV